MTTSDALSPAVDTDLVLRAGEAAAAVLPASTPLEAAGTQPGTDHVTAAFAGAATADLTTDDGAVHRIAVLVGQDLVTALSESPLGGLDLGAAVQPGIDAAAAVLGARASAAAVTELALVVSDLEGPFTAVPMVGEAIDAALLVADSLAPAPAAPAAPAPVEAPVVEVPAEAAPAPVPAAVPAPAVPAPAVPAPAEQLAAQVSEPAPTLASTPAAAPVHPAQSVPQRPAPAPRIVQPVAAPVVHQQLTAETAQMFAAASPSAPRGIEMLAGVDMEVTVELGRTRMAVRDLLALSPGTVLELDRAADGPADLLVNGRLIARGEVVVVDEDFGLRITEIVEDATV
ncbi:flagellar motor switch protein FliN [Nocardioides yefusunii]|uniref:Flagellar motor switch protein FliN n=1 Tax=Nocardioides yefusunii TaxID=2500546 RepID=A0ABW1R0J3_9ACTN|nr:flagellar motor switch protein FliN [Nocardioides yefusunii]